LKERVSVDQSSLPLALEAGDDLSALPGYGADALCIGDGEE
jgi:hypothetical protein